MNPKKGKQPSPNKSIFAKRLSDTRRAKGWTQWEFAEMLGSTHMSIVYWETDRRKPRIDTLVEITKLLQVSADWLLGLDTACDTMSDKVKQLERERDAAVEELDHFCDNCKYVDNAYGEEPCPSRTEYDHCDSCPGWQWRGVKMED